MSVAFSAGSESHTGTTGNTSASSFSWTHTQTGTPKGVLVFVFTNASAQDATGVTYGGVTVPAVVGGAATDSTGEPRAVQTFFLGSNALSGNQTVEVSRNNNANVMYAVCFTVTADRDCEYAGVTTESSDGTLAEVNVDDGSPGTDSLRFAAVNSALNAVPAAGANTTINTGWSIDFGTNVARAGRETTAGQGSRPVGFSSGTSDDKAAVYLAILEARQVAPGAGAVVAAGFAPSTQGDRSVRVTWAQLVAPDAGVVNTTVEPGCGSIAVGGFAPSLAVALYPAAGSVEATGLAPSVSVGDQRNIEVTTGAIVATGFAPSAERTDNQVAAPPAGSVVAGGFAPFIGSTEDRYAYPGAGSVEASGQAPTASAEDHRYAYPGTGTVEVAGLAPTAVNSGDRSVVVSWAQLVVPQPVGVANTDAEPAAGTAVVQGFAPQVGTISILVEWDDVTGEDGYRVKWGLASGTYVWSADVAADTTSYLITGLVYGTTYYIRVYALVGGVEQDPSDELVLTAGYGFVPGTAAVVVSGLAPSVEISGNVYAYPAAGTIVASGQAPTLSATDHRLAYPAAGSVEASGQAPTVSSGENLFAYPDAGTIEATGLAPTLDASDHRETAPGHGSVAATGLAPTVETTDHRIAEPGAGSIVVASTAPTLQVGDSRQIAPDAGAVAVLGLAPTVEQTTTAIVYPPAGSVEAQGFAPSATSGDDRYATPAAGSVAAVGFAPTLQVTGHHEIAPPAGTLEASGSAPTATVTGQHVVEPAAGSVVASGQAPQLLQPGIATPAAGALAVTGLAPRAIVSQPVPSWWPPGRRRIGSPVPRDDIERVGSSTVDSEPARIGNDGVGAPQRRIGS